MNINFIIQIQMNKNTIRLQNKVNNLLKKNANNLIPQRSPEWYLARNIALNASEIAACLTHTEEVCKDYMTQFNLPNFKLDGKCCSHFDTREDFIVNKGRAFFGENVFIDSIFTLWGKKYEEIATRMYRVVYKTDVLEFGSLVHPRLKWLRCSPDGITPDGTLVEIKCPFKRKINGIVPFHYYIQCMLQLEVCDLETCDFLECELIELKTIQEFIDYELKEFNPGEFQHKGILINKVSEPDNSETKYIYPPDSLITTDDYINWYKNQQETIQEEITPIFYVIVKWNVIKVKRNKEWFSKIIQPILKENHTFIRKLQNDKKLFDDYRESIRVIKNKKFIEMYNNTECLIGNDDSDQDSDNQDDDDDYYDDYYWQDENENKNQVENDVQDYKQDEEDIQDNICLLSEN